MAYGPGNPGRPPGQFDFDRVESKPAWEYPNVFPPGQSNEDLQHDISDLDLDSEDPGDWWRDLFDIPGNDPFGAPQTPGGPGNPIDYDAPWNVGAHPSWPGYQAGPSYDRRPLVPPPGVGPGTGFPSPRRNFPNLPAGGPPRFDIPGVIPPDPDNPGASGTPSLVPGQSAMSMQRQQMARYQQMQQMRQRQQMMMQLQQLGMQQTPGTPGMNSGVSGPMPQQAY